MDSPAEWCFCAVMLRAFVWKLSRVMCRYQSLRNEASEALHLLKGAVCDLCKQDDSSGSKFQSTGLEPYHYSQTD